MNKNKMKKEHLIRIEELDALRGIAALIVVFFHFTMGRPEANIGFKYGTTGVDLFFIISGFVIFMSLTKVNNSVDFIINRVSRLYPTYWASVTFTFLLICIVSIIGNVGKINFIHYLGNMTMFEFYLNMPYLDGAYWTMIIEMLFYCSILILFHFKKINYLNIIGISLSITVVVLTHCFYQNYSLVQFLIKWIPLLQFIPLFFAGTLFYNIFEKNTKLFQNYSLILICLICQIFLFDYAGSYNRFLNHFEYSIMLIIHFTIFVLFVNNKLKWIVNKYTLYLGKISFALYLTHQFLSLSFIIPFLTNRLNVNLYVTFFIALVSIILVASFITFYIEIPMGKKMKAKLRSMKEKSI